MTAPIERLAALVGLAPGYWDVDGVWRAPAAADRAALLEGLGWPVRDEAALGAAVERLETAAWRTPLPPVAVVASGRAISVPMVLPEGDGASWRVELEDGGTVEGSLEPGPAEASVTLGGRRLGRRGLDLPPLAEGYHRLVLPGLDAAMALIATPEHCFVPAPLAAGGRVWGLAVQLYAVRSRRNWGVGDYTDLARLAAMAGQAGADLIGVNPLHARSLGRPGDCSPYSPTDRLALDPFSIDVEALPELALSPTAQAMIAAPEFQARLEALRRADLVDYAGVASVKLPALRLLHEAFKASAPAALAADYRAFVAAGGTALLHHAEFEALRRYHDAAAGQHPWWDWPAEPSAESPALSGEVELELWLQFAADRQVAAAAAAARASGMRIGLYRDLAVGAAGDSAESWAMPALAARVSVGAPPDGMSRQGQNWGLPAPDPIRLEAAAYAPYATLLGANMRHAGALRIDHAMSLARLFVIPPGGSGSAGTYLAYPFEALVGLVALESRRHGCLVVGEDLGTVPEGFREAMARRQVLSYKVLAFERYPDGAFRAPRDYPHASLATASTHDLAPLAGYWTGADIAVKAEIGLIEDRGRAEAERAQERRQLLALFDWQGVTPSPRPDPAQPGDLPQAVIDTLHRLIAGSGSAIALLQLGDALGETRPVNIPGTSHEYPNWRPKLTLALEDAAFGPQFAAAAGLFAEARPRGTGPGPAG